MSHGRGSDSSDGRILLVEDHPNVRDLYREQLERAGSYTVLVASDGIEALERIESEQPDLVFLDLDLPHIGGREVIERAHETDPGLPIVIVTGLDSGLQDDVPGAAEYLVKPIGNEALTETASALLESGVRTADL